MEEEESESSLSLSRSRELRLVAADGEAVVTGCCAARWSWTWRRWWSRRAAMASSSTGAAAAGPRAAPPPRSETVEELESLIARRFRASREQAVSHLDRIRAIDARFRAHCQEVLERAGEQARRSKDRLRCPRCGNEDEQYFVHYEREGSITCARCGVMVRESEIRDADWVRQFEGDEYPSFHGPPPDTRFSSEHNLRTGFAQPDRVPGGGSGSGSSASATREMSLLQSRVEMDLSNMVSRDHRTRQGYKEEMKRKYFELLDEAGSALNLHGGTVNRAKTLFAEVRDDTEQLHDAEGVAAGCLVLALREARDTEHGGRKRRPGADADADAVAINRFKCKFCGQGFGDKATRQMHVKEECEVKRERDAAGGAPDEGAVDRGRLSTVAPWVTNARLPGAATGVKADRGEAGAARE